MTRLDRTDSPKKIALAMVSCLLAWTLTSPATELPDPTPEIELRFLEAGEDLIMPAAGGWPLSLALTMNETKLQGIGGPPGTFPALEHQGFLVFEDPDGCPSWDEPFKKEMMFNGLTDQDLSYLGPPKYPSAYRRCSNPPALPWPRDEKLLEITPGRSVPPNADDCTYLEILSHSFDATETYRERIGPCVGSKGYGYGRNTRLPGLLVLADHGPGMLTDELFNRLSPAAARNLAGLFESITYALKDARAKTSVFVHMNVPRALFSPIVQIDQYPGDLCEGEPGPIVRVDGGPATCALDPYAIFSRKVTVRAFVVNGQAPAVLRDLNHDGVIDIRDASLAGLELLSGETQIRFRLHHDDPQHWPVYYDLDGNGEVGGPPPAPAGPADLTNPPR